MENGVIDVNRELQDVVSWLNQHFSQDSDEYDFCMGAKPQVIRHSEHTAISLWACGAIVCIGSILYFIDEDDGSWFLNERNAQSAFSIGWSESFVNALNSLKEYVDKNGTPVYFSGSDIVCLYQL